MKIGIVTFHFSDNFGAALQAYALRAFLIKMGHDAEFVNYCPEHVEKGGSFRIGITKDDLKANFKVLYLQLTALRSRLFGNSEQKAEFGRFRKDQLGLRGSRISTIEGLQESDGDHQLLICGSDQIWSPSVQHGLDSAYFLDFGPPTARRISFAASFGAATQESLEGARAGFLLRRLDAIAVREKTAINIVRNLAGVDPAWVCDPTCLLTSYDHLIRTAPETDSGHVFCYALRTDVGVRQIASAVAGWEGEGLISPANPFSRWSAIGDERHPGPAGWVSLINGSRFVVTNSFHGTMFSILLKKPFIVVGLPGKKGGLNDRMLSLLERLDLSSRFLPTGDLVAAESVWKTPIDWEAVEKRLAEWRELSVRYLEEQIAMASKC